MSESSEGIKKKTIILACSGAADVGALADRTARALAKDGKGSMFCLAAVGAGNSAKLKDFLLVDEVVTIDGCSIGCARIMAENAGRTPVAFDLTALGYVKGKTPVSEDTIHEASSHIALRLDGATAGGSCCA